MRLRNMTSILLKYSGMSINQSITQKNFNMKNISFLLLCMILMGIVAGCRDEERIRIPEFPNGANMRIIMDPDHNRIRFDHLDTDVIAFDAYSQNTDLDLVEFIATYKGISRVIATYHQADFSDDGKVRVELKATDFATAFGVPGFLDGSEGGNFQISPWVTLTDGRMYPDWIRISETDSILNIATSVQAAASSAFTMQVLASITCPPFDISGEYRVVSAIGESTDGCCSGSETMVSGNTVTLTAEDPYTFVVSDFSGGLYLEWYDVYGITSPDDSPGNLLYNCDEVNFVNTLEPFGAAVLGGGSYDPVTGVIVYSWINGYGDNATVTLEPL